MFGLTIRLRFLKSAKRTGSAYTMNTGLLDADEIEAELKRLYVPHVTDMILTVLNASALSYSEVKALCAGNPLIKEKMTLENEIAELKMVKSSYDNRHYQLQYNVLKRYPAQIKSIQRQIKGIEAELIYLKDKPTDLTIRVKSYLILLLTEQIILTEICRKCSERGYVEVRRR